MATKKIHEKSIHINAPIERVWETLVNPTLTKKYMYGCEALSDWRVGSELLWQGIADDKEVIYVKGTIKEFSPNERLVYTAIDPNATYIHSPENHIVIEYDLRPSENGTTLTVISGDYATVADGENRYNESVGVWGFVMNGIKTVAEEG